MDTISAWGLGCIVIGAIGVIVSWVNLCKAIDRINAACKPRDEK